VFRLNRIKQGAGWPPTSPIKFNQNARASTKPFKVVCTRWIPCFITKMSKVEGSCSDFQSNPGIGLSEWALLIQWRPNYPSRGAKEKEKKSKKKILLMFYAHWLILGTSRYMMESKWKNSLRTLWDKDGLVSTLMMVRKIKMKGQKKEKKHLYQGLYRILNKKIEVRQSINKASWDWSRLALLDQLEGSRMGVMWPRRIKNTWSSKAIVRA